MMKSLTTDALADLYSLATRNARFVQCRSLKRYITQLLRMSQDTLDSIARTMTDRKQFLSPGNVVYRGPTWATYGAQLNQPTEWLNRILHKLWPIYDRPVCQ